MFSFILKTVVFHQATVMIGMRLETANKYAMARAVAKGLNKPLLVVGGPLGSSLTGKLFGIRAHGCGNMCTDIDPRACEGCNPVVLADIKDLPFMDNQFGAVFCAHVLEHMPNAEACGRAWQELHRVAEEVFICLPPKKSLWAWFVPDHYLWVQHVGDGVIQVQERITGKKAFLPGSCPEGPGLDKKRR